MGNIDNKHCGCGHEHDEHEHEHHHDHEHEEHCGCGCGHEHDEHEHEHHHDHQHEEHCGCGCDHEHDEHEHEHHHDHEHDEHCGCGCDHEHDHEHEEVHHHEHKHFEDDGMMNRGVYILENLGCANCAAKMESRINDMPEVADATITYATKQLRIVAENPEILIPEIEKICNSIESGIHIVEKKRSTSASKNKEENRKTGKLTGQQKDIISILVGAAIFAVLVGIKLATNMEYNLPMIIAFIVSYLILGGEVLLTAGRNILKGQIFDENFLMSIATLGAFAIAEYPEAVGVMLFFRIGELFEDIAVERSRSQIMSAVDLRPEVVNLCKDNEVEIIPAEEAVIGDLLIVRPGDRVPLDGVVTKGESRIDTSAVTGEPVPVGVKPGSKLVSGCVNTTGVLTMRVERDLSESMVTRILDSVENAAASKPKIDNFITKFARIYTPIVVVLALITAFGIPFITGDEFYPWIYTALTFLVMSCPCALVLSVPLAFFCGIGAGSKRGILFKGGIVIEALAKIKVIVMDKTGTITHGNFVVQSVNAISKGDESVILALAASCEKNSTHPIGVSIVEAMKNEDIPEAEKVKEIAGKGISAHIDGKTVLCGNQKLMELYDVNLDKFVSAGDGAEVLIAVEGVLLGNILIADTIKDEAREAIERINRKGIETAMLTGDSKASASAVAAKTGIKRVFAKLLPEHKLNQLLKLREEVGDVMFVGDGINDAPVLAGANVGAAMGSGADAAIEAADIVFMNSNMDAIPTALDIASKTVAIAKENVTFALAIKIAVMILGLTGIYANMWLAVFADTGVAMLCILNSIRVMIKKYK